jgi:hypothetical protein
MTQITWKAGFDYDGVDIIVTPKNLSVVDLHADNNRISHFSVAGGAKRLIDLNDPDVASLPLELQDARKQKNLLLYIPLKNGAAFNHLSYFFMKQTPVSILFAVVGYRGKTPMQALFLHSEPQGAVIAEPPMPIHFHGRKFTVRFKFTKDVSLSHNYYPHGWNGKGSYEEVM